MTIRLQLTAMTAVQGEAGGGGCDHDVERALNISDPVPASPKPTQAARSRRSLPTFAGARGRGGQPVWRHLATIPALCLAPGGCCGRSMLTARSRPKRRRCTTISTFPASAVSTRALAATELLGGDLGTIRNILAAYDRTNAMALIALSALLCRLEASRRSRSRVLARIGVAHEPPLRSRCHRCPAWPSCRQRPPDWSRC